MLHVLVDDVHNALLHHGVGHVDSKEDAWGRGWLVVPVLILGSHDFIGTQEAQL